MTKINEAAVDLVFSLSRLGIVFDQELHILLRDLLNYVNEIENIQ